MTFQYSEQPNCRIKLVPFSSFPGKEDLPGTFDCFEDKRLQLSCPEPLRSSQAITVEHDDMLFLGEVLGCTPKSGDQWTVLIKVEQIVTALQSLLCLRNELMEAERPTRSVPLREAALAA